MEDRVPDCLTPARRTVYIHRLQLSGPVAEWLCRGLQILARRFDSGPGLQFLNRVKFALESPDRVCYKPDPHGRKTVMPDPR